MNKKIFWLASYPKSGNTWTRAFLTHLLQEEDKDFNINNLIGGPIASSRSLVEEYIGMESTDFTINELEELRPESFRFFAEKIQKDKWFMKIHDAYTFLSNGAPLIPSDISLGALYLVRNPLDVSVSFAHHNGISIEKMIPMMAKSSYAFCDTSKGVRNQLKQKLLTWGEHYESWTNQSEIPVLVIRYEDMKAEPLATFKKIVAFFKLNKSEEQIQNALDACAFDKLKKAEDEDGFREKNKKSERFFRKGKIGSWKEELSEEQIDILLKDHKVVMIKLNYLNSLGKPLY
jgi:hypothetical protein